MVAQRGVTILQEIDCNESLLRAVSVPSCLDADHRATHLAFHLRNAETDLSLSRLLFESLAAFLKRAFRFRFTFLNPKDVFAGAVEIVAGDVKGLDEHIVLKATPSPKTLSHAGIYFKNPDGSNYVGVDSTEPVDSSILGYEMALASIVRKVYDREGRIIWHEEENPEGEDCEADVHG